MIKIINISPLAPNQGVNRYRLQINDNVICEFEHDRHWDGLAACLRDAAKAVELDHEKRVNEIADKLDDVVK